MLAIPVNSRTRSAPDRSPLIGVVPGEGSAPELIDAACHVLRAVAQQCDVDLRLRYCPTNDYFCSGRGRENLSDELATFVSEIFNAGGAILAGAVGGRFVYEMRRRFHLYYKLNPLRSYRELLNACRLKLNSEAIDILLIRENLEGIYSGDSIETRGQNGTTVSHTFIHHEKQVRALLEIAASIAAQRRKVLTVVGKNSGTPVIYDLWRRCAVEVSEAAGVQANVLDIDYAAYKLLQEPETLDVIAAPNCFGDILSDLGGVLAGSRGLTFGGSYSNTGAAVYQTNHGAAHDLANSNSANPVGQIFSAAMMLRETFQLRREAQLIGNAVLAVWRDGWRTDDLAEPGCKIAGTREFGELVAEQLPRVKISDETCSFAG